MTTAVGPAFADRAAATATDHERRPAIPWMAPLARLVDAWFDMPVGLSTAVYLVLFVVCWTLFQVLSYASIDLHPDLVEVYAWGRHPSLGYYKHPPLGGLTTAVWFSVFPARDWAFQLLAMVNAAIGLGATALIARRYLSGDKRLLVLLLLLLTPFYQFHGERFASNQTLLSTWPLAVYAFLRAAESRRVGWAIAAGAAAALAMLGKYYSIFLVAGLLAGALVHPNRAAYLRSSSPWISTAVGIAVLAPHIAWLVGSDFPPFHYALSVHAGAPLGAVLLQVAGYVVGAIGYVSLLLLAYVIATRPDRATFKEALWPSDRDRRPLAILLWVPLLSPIPVAIASGGLLTSLWTMSAWFLLPILLLAPPAVTVSRRAATGIAALVAAITLGALVASPAIAWLRFVSEHDRLYFRLLADAAGTRWQAATGRPLSIVAGDPDLAAATTFYAASHPDALPFSDLKTAPWITPSRLAAEGWIALCKARDHNCLDGALRLAGERSDLVRTDIELVAHFAGRSSAPGNFTLLLVPPISP